MQTSLLHSSQLSAHQRKNQSPLRALRFVPINYFAQRRGRGSSPPPFRSVQRAPPFRASSLAPLERRRRFALVSHTLPPAPAKPDYSLCDLILAAVRRRVAVCFARETLR